LTISEEKQLRHKAENAEIDVIKKCYIDMKLAVENKDKEVNILNVTILKSQMLDMQQLLNNPEKLIQITRTTKLEILQ
jgi:hypothetical protein